MKSLLTAPKSLVLNELGAFASLIDGTFPALKHPVLVLKAKSLAQSSFWRFASAATGRSLTTWSITCSTTSW